MKLENEMGISSFKKRPFSSVLCSEYKYVMLMLFASLLFFPYYAYQYANAKDNIHNNLEAKRRPVTTFGGEGETLAILGSIKHSVSVQNQYRDKLESAPRVIYKTPNSFIEYGEPVGHFVPQSKSKIKRILTWTNFFGNSSYIPNPLQCPGEMVCEVTSDRSTIASSDAVVVHMRDLHSPSELPKIRLPHQRWVAFLMESPYNFGLRFPSFAGIFNYTATHRRDSDVRATYFTVRARSKKVKLSQIKSELGDILKSKSRTIASMISNCGQQQSERMRYIANLSDYISVDRYGYCGKMKCPRNTDSCEKTMTKYKFYLSFENSKCKDYITEKAGYPLFKWQAVPIVMGGGDPSDYEAALPPGSYINSAGFDSPKALAEYLTILDKNDTMYLQYHNWRKEYTGNVEQHQFWCDLCRKLHNESLPVQTYRDIDGWYKQDVCRV